MNEVTYLQAHQLKERISSVREISFDTISELFIFAVDHSISRQPIKDLIATETFNRSKNVARRLSNFAKWCNSHEFYFNAKPSENRLPLPNLEQRPQLAELSRDLQESGRAIGEMTNYGRAHKYWFFRPAWEIDSSYWSEFFGEADPALTIAFYVSSFFKVRYHVSDRPKVQLTTDDLEVLEWLLSHGASYVARGKGHSADQLTPILRGAIATACGLEEVVKNPLTWRSEEFLTGIKELPAEFADYLVEYWAKRADVGNNIETQELRDLAIKQALSIAMAVLAYFASDSVQAKELAWRISFISDETVLAVHGAIRVLEMEARVNELESFSGAFAEAIYNARTTFFGGVFPFTLHDASELIGSIARDDGRWLADFAYYAAGEYEIEIDRFSLFGIHEDQQRTEGSVRTNRQAYKRFQAYANALMAIQEEGLRELACAWWAFFIASQSLACAGLGVPTSAVSKFVELTKPLVSDHQITRALEFAVQEESARPDSVTKRVFLDAFNELLSGLQRGKPKQTAQIVHMGVTREQAQQFLRNKLGSEVWDRLEAESKDDLIEVEQLWHRSSQDLGAGRSDWGSLVALYSRPIEAEARKHIGPVMLQLKAHGICEVSELTLGGCIDGIRRAAKAIRKNGGAEVPEAIKTRVDQLQEYFADKGPFIKNLRDRADHANREQLVTPQEFLRWRETIFFRQLFPMLLGLQANSLP